MEAIIDSNWTGWTETEPVPKFPQFWFEKVDIPFWFNFADNYLTSLIIVNLVFYYVAIRELSKFMKDRKPFELRLLIAVWNFFVSIVSFTVLYRVCQEVVFELKDGGFIQSLCIRRGLHMSTAFWSVVFGLFRPLFILDTMFLILRKKPVGNFHLLHHTLSIIFAPFLLASAEPITRYFGMANLLVHAVDYLILALKSLKISIPKSNEIMITLEVVQMAFMLALSMYTVYLKETTFCLRHPGSVMLTNFVCGALLTALPVSLLLPKIRKSLSPEKKILSSSPAKGNKLD